MKTLERNRIDKMVRDVESGAYRLALVLGFEPASAERVVLELKEKLGSVGSAGEPTPLSPQPHHVARDALVELGYSLAEAEEALAGTDPDAPPEERVREALKRAA